MNRFRFCFSKRRHYCKPNGSFEEDFFRREFDFLGKRGAFTKDGQAVRSNFHWSRDYLNCDGYGSFNNISLTCKRNFIQKRLFERIKNAVNVNQNGGQKNFASSHKISHKLNPDKRQGAVEKREKTQIATLSVDPSFNELLKKVLRLFNESMCEFGLNRSDDTQPVVEMNENVGFNYGKKIHQNTELDSELQKHFIRLSKNEKVISLKNFTEKLPCFNFKNSFLDLVAKNQVVLVTGSTGSGKSSQLVQYLLDDFILSSKGSLCNIVCIVPRRVCAIALAERIAAERGESVGESVGYQIRFGSKLSRFKRGCINFMTSGMFLNYWEDVKYINSLSHIFIDEVHERSIHCDLILALMKMLMLKKPELKIVLLSATTNVNLLTTYMNGAPHLEIAGVTFPVEEYYLEDVLKKTKYVFNERKNLVGDKIFYHKILPYADKIRAKNSYPKYVTSEMEKPVSEELNEDFIAETVHYIIKNEDLGCILIFLPGLRNIVRLKELIQKKPWYSTNKHEILVMHSVLNAEEQKLIFIRPLENVWKIILSTPILETSVTVDDIKYIIDSGKVKVTNYGAVSKVLSVGEEWISKTNAIQRKGRAGRVQKGKCFKLYSRAREESFPMFPVPEILISNLEDTYLAVKAMNVGCVESFLDTLIDPPDKKVVSDSLKSLKQIGALDSKGELTPLGLVLVKIQASPQIGKLLVMGAIFSCADPICSIAACLSIKSPFLLSAQGSQQLKSIKESFDRGDKSDHLIFSRVMYGWENAYDQTDFCHSNELSWQGLKMISSLKKQYGKVLNALNFLPRSKVNHRCNNLNSNNTNILKAILCAGFYPNYTFKWDTGKKTYTLQNPEYKLMLFHGKSYCKKVENLTFESPYFVYYERIMSSVIFIHDATMVDILPMILFGGNVSVLRRKSDCIVCVGEIIRVGMPEEIAFRLMDMRDHLNSICDMVLRKPETLTLLNEIVIPSLVELLSSKTSVTFE